MTHPGDVPADELQPLLEDKRLSFTSIGVYAFLRSRELQGLAPITAGDVEHDRRHGDDDPDDIYQGVRDLLLAGYLNQTEHGYLTTSKSTA